MELKLEGITKSYTKGKKRKNALEDFTLTLTEGVYGLLGPNGAGKSTLINIITGIIGRDSGSISFTDGNDNSFLSHLGFMPQGMDFYRNFTAKDYIKYIMALKKYSPDNADEYALTTLGKVNLRADADKKIGAFSGGMKQRLGIAQAIVGEPKVLIFDEPTAGLDAKERIRFRNVISSLANDKIVILATHIVTDIAFIAKNVVLIDGGKMISCASQSELCNEIYGKVWEVLTDYETGMELMRTKRVSNVISEDDRFNVRVVSDEKPHPDAVNVQPALEDVCIYHFGEIGE